MKHKRVHLDSLSVSSDARLHVCIWETISSGCSTYLCRALGSEGIIRVNALGWGALYVTVVRVNLSTAFLLAKRLQLALSGRQRAKMVPTVAFRVHHGEGGLTGAWPHKLV